MSDPIRREFQRLSGNNQSMPPEPLFGTRQQARPLRVFPIIAAVWSAALILMLVGNALFPKLQGQEIGICQSLVGSPFWKEGPGRIPCFGPVQRYSLIGTAHFGYQFMLRNGFEFQLNFFYDWQLPRDPEILQKLHEEVRSPDYLRTILRSAVLATTAQVLSDFSQEELLREARTQALAARIRPGLALKFSELHAEITNLTIEINPVGILKNNAKRSTPGAAGRISR